MNWNWKRLLSLALSVMMLLTLMPTNLAFAEDDPIIDPPAEETPFVFAVSGSSVVEVGATTQLTSNVLDAKNDGYLVVWESDAPEIATVDQTGAQSVKEPGIQHANAGFFTYRTKDMPYKKRSNKGNNPSRSCGWRTF